MHSFYVPAFRMKHDVVPGHYYTAWFEAKMTGVFPIECAEYCGTSHSRMIGRVRVLSEGDYRAWLADRRPLRTVEGEPASQGDPGGDLVVMGREVASRRACFNCHTLDGQPHIGPSWAGLFDSEVKLSDGRTVRADPEYLTRSMMDPQVDVVAGYAPVMPSYRGILKEPEVAALVEFIRSIETRPFAPSIQLPKVTAQSIGQPQEPQP
ncbi:MAG: c-type cytochrome [Polyangiaceae bacterium]